MKKLFKTCLLMLALMMGFGVQAQEAAPAQMQVTPLPVDTAVRVGQLPNGLTYYIRHNENPKGQADFYIAQKVGSILEEDNQRGLAHFLEHMCFNGTENFPGKGIIEWLESVGVKFGQNLNAFTSIDETVYNISAVPVARKSVQDSCLLILHDWACALTLDPKEIDAERGVIHEEWRRSNVGQMRVIEQLLPTIYPDNKYGYRLPIGTMEVVDNFPPQALVDYYHTWYRPDQQGIIVVGDIDPDYIEGKIKEMFSGIPMPENAKAREYLPVQDTPGTIYAIGSDPEMPYAAADIMFKFDDPMPREIRNSAEYLQYAFMEQIIDQMLNNRLSELSHKADAPFANANFNIGNFFVAKTKKSADIEVIGKGNDILPAMEAAYRELLRAARGGFTQGEYERAGAELRSRYQKMYDERNNTPTENYSREYYQSFLENTPIPGIGMEKMIVDALSQQMPVQMINGFLPEIIGKDNRVVMVLAPQNDTFKVPAEQEIAEMMARVEAEEIEPYRDEVRTDPLIPALPAPGKIVSEQTLSQWDATEYTLSNGLKVVVKPTKFKDNEIKFEALAKGGWSTEDDSQAANIIFLPYSSSREALGTYSNSDLQKYLQGKQVNVDLSVSAYDRELSGNSTVADLPSLMELIYAFFTEFNLDEDEFAATQNLIRSQLENQESTPDFMFGKLLYSLMYTAPERQALSSAVVGQADRQGTVDLVRRMLANPADFTFYFVGNIDPATFKPLMEQYIATLPVGGKSVELRKDASDEIGLGEDTLVETMAMQTPQTWAAYVFSGPVEFSGKNDAMLQIASQVLSKRLLNKVREEMGATYSIGAYGRMSRLSDNNTMIMIPFPMKPEMREEVFAAIDKIFNDMCTDITDAEVNPAKEFMVKEAREGREENADWLEAMAETPLNGVDTFTDAEQTINSITTQDVMDFWKQVLAGKNLRRLILNPAE